MRIFTAAQMKQAEADAVRAGTSYKQLMENAGTAAAKTLQTLAKKAGLAHAALLLCGKGNNAGDAFVVARLLAAQGWEISLLPLCGSVYSPLAALNFARLPAGVQTQTPQTANFNTPFVVDGVFGTGFKGGLPPGVAAAFLRANRGAGLQVALDLPSGLNCDTGEADPATFTAAHTLTFGALKPALTMPALRGLYGQVHLLDIGL